MPAYFKYCAKHNNQKSQSFYNGKERIGYKVKVCNTEDEIKKALKDGWIRELNQLTKTTRKKAVKDEQQDSEVRSRESSEGSGPVNEVQDTVSE